MAISKAAVTVLAPSANNVPAGTTKAAPIAGPTIDCRAYYGGELTYRITNGATGPTAAGAVTFQSSHDGLLWADYQTCGADALANGGGSGSVLLDLGVMYLRAIAYGNTIQPVTVEAYLQAVTGR